MQDEAGVGLAVVLVHDVSYSDAVIVAFADGGLVKEGVGNRPPLQESLFLKDPHLLGNGRITGPGLRKGIDQFPDAKLAFLPEDIHDLFFLRREFLFHFCAFYVGSGGKYSVFFLTTKFYRRFYDKKSLFFDWVSYSFHEDSHGLGTHPFTTCY